MLLTLLRRAWPGMRLTFYDLLDRVDVASAFSWRAAAVLLARALRTGVLPLPHACVRGTAALTFTRPAPGAPPRLVRHAERISLVPFFASGRARNRRVARDLISFLDGRRPPALGLSDWDDLRAERLNLRSVPGLGQFDVDGLSSDDRTRLFDDVSTLLTFATALVLLFGAAAAAVYSDELKRNRQLRALTEEDGDGGDASAAAREGERMRRRRLLALAVRADE